MSAETLPEPDRATGAPHPRETGVLHGQAAAEAQFLDASAQGRLHHAWLLTGPRGVGKATLAWRIARFLIAEPPPAESGLFGDAPPVRTSLDLAADHPVARRVAALAEPRLFLLRRPVDERTGRLKQDITVDEVRRLKSYFQLSAADGGRRVAIVDSADDLNPSAANALLKLLEEPPKDVTLLLVSHQPRALLPTIRSRCRELRLAPLSEADFAAALGAIGIAPSDAARLYTLSGGSVGEAARLAAHGALAAYADLVALVAGAPRMDRPRASAFAARGGGRGAEAEAATDALFGLVELLIGRLARAGTTGSGAEEAAPGEAAALARLSPDPVAGRDWADLGQVVAQRHRHGRAVNLDPAGLLLDTLVKINETAARTIRR